jgi:serine phosphatase RsbU (regulator of sigma subunit)
MKGSVWVLSQNERGVFAGGESGVWFTDGTRMVQISKAQCSGMLLVPEKKWLIVAGNAGVRFYNSETFTLLLDLPEVMLDAYGIACQTTSENACEIWLGSKTQGVSQIIVTDDLKYQVDFYMGMEDGLPNDWVCAFQAKNKVLFGTSLGMLRFISSSEISELTHDTTAVRGYFDITDFPKGSSGQSVTSFVYNDALSFAALDNFVYQIDLKDSTMNNSFFKTLQLGRFNVIYKQQQNIWIGGDDGLALYDARKASTIQKMSPEMGIRRITVGKDSVIWSGDIPYSGKEIVLPFTQNSLRIDLFSLFSDNGFRLRYSWKLEGMSDEFSDWSNDHIITFSHLREGSYVLHVKAVTPGDQETDETLLYFQILPPWYRSWWAYVIYGIGLIFFIYILILLNTRRLKEKNRKLEEIVKIRTQEVVAQKHEIEIQKETILEILNDLNASITYAQRIQEAILPSKELLKHCFPEHFILYKPRNVVSGDYYWASQVGDWTVITVADCTGHGVPGAFMSMLGISFLNEIVRKKEVTAPDKILNALRDAVIEALRQSLTEGKQKDGMDISLCAINIKTMQCLWAGANNSLYIIRNAANSQLVEFKADKMPIGIHVKMYPFTCHEVKLESGDCLYMTSDGYPDQFGGEKGKKFMSKNLKELLTENAALPMESQKAALEKALDEWMNGHEEKHAQVDDITIMGIRV